VKIIFTGILFVSLLAGAAWACTVQTEDDSVPGDGHGWGGLYYYYTPFSGYLVDSKHEDFAGSDDAITEHDLVLEGVIGFLTNFYGKVDLPYTSITTKMTGAGTGAGATDETTSGLGDASIAVKYLFLNPEEGARAGVLVGASLPTGDEDNGLGSGMVIPNIMLVGGIPAGGENRLYGTVSYEYVPEKDSVDAGDSIGYTMAYDFCLGSGFTIPLEVLGNYEMESKVDGTTDDESGSHIITVSPSVTWTFAQWATVCAGVYVPVLKQGYADDYDFSPHLTFFYNF
jgi:hypothetical protein